MPKTLTLITLCFAAGIAAAHVLFFCMHVAVPVWADAVLLAASTLLAAGLYAAHRRIRHAPLFAPHTAFAVLLCMLSATLGFARYTAEARRVQLSWQQMAHPPVNRGNPDEMDYRAYRWTQGVEPDATARSQRLRQAALGLRDRLLRRYASAGLADDAYALIAAMTLGDRSALTPTVRDLYAEAGAAHLLALSGMHLGIVVGMLLWLICGRLALSAWRLPAGALTIVLIWAYCLMAGLPPSLLRAAIMTSVAVAAAMLRRQDTPSDTLVLTALVMLAARPFALIDVGAQLSFAAMAGILHLHPQVMAYAFRRWRTAMLWLARKRLTAPLHLLSMSICAQLCTTPLVALYFHRIATYAPLFNLIYVPVTTMLVYGAILVLLLSATVPAAASTVAAVLTWLIGFQMGMMRWEVSLPGAVVYDFWSARARPQLVVYNNRHCPALHIIVAPSQSYLLLPRPDAADSGLRRIRDSFWRRRLTAEPQTVGRHYMAVGACRVLMLDAPVSPHAAMELPRQEQQDVDILWLTCDYDGYLTTLSAFVRPQMVVADASLAPWVRRQVNEECEALGWRHHDIMEQGALRMPLLPQHTHTASLQQQDAR